MSEKTMIHDLTEGNVAKKLLVFATPYMLSNLLQTVYNLVDMVVIGQFAGSIGLSAVSVGGDLIHVFTFICMGFSATGQVIIAQYVGKKDRGALCSTIGTFATFVLSVGLLFTILGLVFGRTFLSWMNVPEEAAAQAYDYTIVCVLGIIPVYGYNVASSVLRGMGDSKTPFIFVVIATVINIVLDLLFIAVMGMESLGAALATVIGQAVSFVAAVAYLYKRREAFGFDFKLKSFKPDREKLIMVIKLGIPMALQSCAINVSMVVVNSFINAFGVAASAVTGVGNKICTIANVVTTGMNQAGAAMVGQNFGAGKLKRVSQIMWVVGYISIIFSAVLSVLMLLFPEQIFAIFNDDPEILALSHTYKIIAVVTFISCAVRAPFLALIHGQGHASLSLLTSLIDSVLLRIGLALLLGMVLEMGVMGFWLSTAIASYSYMLVGGVYYFSGRWKKRKLVVKGS